MNCVLAGIFRPFSKIQKLADSVGQVLFSTVVVLIAHCGLLKMALGSIVACKGSIITTGDVADGTVVGLGRHCCLLSCLGLMLLLLIVEVLPSLILLGRIGAEILLILLLVETVLLFCGSSDLSQLLGGKVQVSRTKGVMSPDSISAFVGPYLSQRPIERQLLL